MALRELFAKFTFEWDQSALDKVTKSTQTAEGKVEGLASELNRAGTVAEGAAVHLGRLHNAEARVAVGAGSMRAAFGQALAAFGIFGGALGAVFGGRAIAHAVEGEIGLAASLAHTSEKTGMSAEALQVMGAIAKQGGVDFEALTGSLTNLTKNVGLFAAGAPTRLKGVFKTLKIGVKDVKGMAPEDVFWKIGKGIASITDPTQKLAFAQRVFGESGALMLDMFHGTAEEVEQQKKLFTELGVVYSETFVHKAHETEKKLQLLGLQMHKIKVNLIAGVLPALMWGAGKLTTFGTAIARVAERTRVFQGAFISGGWMLFAKLLGRLAIGGGGVVGMLRKVFPLIAKLARFLLPWIAWTLILDDIQVFLEGGDSALGRFLDTMFGAGTAAAVLEKIKAGWADIKTAIIEAWNTVTEWCSSLDNDGKRIVAILIGVGLSGAAGLMPLYSVLLKITIAFIAGIARAIGYGASLIATGVQAGIAAGGLWAMAAAAAAAGAAVAGIALALDQAVKLLNEVGGWAALGKGVKSLLGGRGFFAGVDDAANEKARAAAAARGDAIPFRAVPASENIAGVPPMLARSGGANGTLTINDNRSVEVTVPANASPGQTGSAIAAAVERAQPAPNLKAIQAALAGAPNG